MTEAGEKIKAKILAIEKLIAGMWFNPLNMVTWQFSQIEPKDREGTVLIADKSKPVRGTQLDYEIIWVNDDKVLIDLIQPSVAMRYQHQIWVNDKELKIEHINPSDQSKQYLVLNRA